MLRVDQVHVIRHKVLVEGKSARQVAREMGVSRNTICKYLAQSEPRRTEKTRRPRPVFDQVKDRIDDLLEDWGKRTTRKQRITGTRLAAPGSAMTTHSQRRCFGR
jgi:predicted transcriptional regulator